MLVLEQPTKDSLVVMVAMVHSTTPPAVVAVVQVQ
jgi:hypothetical protein